MSIAIKNRGFSLVETLVYSAGVLLLVGAIVTMLVNIYRWYDQATTIPRIDGVGITTVDRFVRDIRTGESITTGSSSFGTTLGSTTIVSIVNGASITKAYRVQNGRIYYTENGTGSYISPSNAYVSKFLLTQITTPISAGMRVELELTYSLRGASTTRAYSGAAIMRNSY